MLLQCSNICIFATDAPSGDVGLAILSSIGLLGMAQFGMRQSAELENQMTSVERISEYTNVPPEGAFATTNKTVLPKNWPTAGNIEFVSLSLRYEEDSRKILNELTFSVKDKVNVNCIF